jgi:hypothetical protein
MSIKPRVLTISALLLLLKGALFASTLTWGPATNITGNSDVATTGSLVDAWDLGEAGVTSTTVNGVLFTGVDVNGLNPVQDSTFNLSVPTNNDPINELHATNSAGSGNAPFSNLSSAYQGLLSNLLEATEGPVTLKIFGLTPGDTYLFEVWYSWSSDPGASTTGFSAGNSVRLEANTPPAPGGLGQFAVGTFTADGTGQQTILASDASDYFNAFELRNTTPVPGVPEPASIVLMGLGALGLAASRKFRRSTTP